MNPPPGDGSKDAERGRLEKAIAFHRRELATLDATRRWAGWASVALGGAGASVLYGGGRLAFLGVALLFAGVLTVGVGLYLYVIYSSKERQRLEEAEAALGELGPP